jgi:hypothetical protein
MSIEIQRKMAMDAIHATTTWQACWPIWEPEILRRTGNLSDARKIYELGSQLKDIFFLTNTGERSQSSVSGGGAAWECLVCWYLNLVFSGTNAVAMRQSRAVVPAVLLDATTITYGNFQTNTESDLCVIVYPDAFPFPAAGKSYLKALSDAIAIHLGHVELGIVQCKTNWNDNSQIPMLWDMVYQASFGPGTHVRIGRNGYAISHLGRFSYSFVTTPTQKSLPKPGSMPVKRTNKLSGGNYWGLPTTAGVALSLSEIFTRNFGSAFKQSVQASISDAIKSKAGLFT